MTNFTQLLLAQLWKRLFSSADKAYVPLRISSPWTSVFVWESRVLLSLTKNTLLVMKQ